MKKHCLAGLLVFIFVLLAGCSSSNNPFQKQVNHDLLNEPWLKRINTDPNQWTRGADSWFLTGEPNRIERYDQIAPSSTAMTTMMVRVPDFTNIQIDGKFRVQIMGRQEHNSVFVVGPNAQARQTVVEMRGSTLCIHQSKDSKTPTNNVIIRIGVRNLCKLTSNGPCMISGRDITSSNLILNSTNSAKIMLSGNMNVSQINQTGSGAITVMGAYTPMLNIYVKGNGTVNVSGRVGVRMINNIGKGNVNIIGADTDGLTIDARVGSKTIVAGYANVKKVVACDDACVYLYWVNGGSTYVYASGRARVGLAGAAKNLNVDVAGSSHFEGQYLHGSNVYVRTEDSSHANVTSDQRMFASAVNRSSIYFFGAPNMVSRYTSGQGAIIPVWGDTPAPLPQPLLQPRPVYK